MTHLPGNLKNSVEPFQIWVPQGSWTPGISWSHVMEKPFAKKCPRRCRPNNSQQEELDSWHKRRKWINRNISVLLHAACILIAPFPSFKCPSTLTICFATVEVNGGRRNRLAPLIPTEAAHTHPGTYTEWE